MKKKILSFGIISVSALFVGCSDNTSLPTAPAISYNSSSSSLSSLENSSNSKPTSSTIVDVKDTTIKHTVITISGSSVNYPDITEEKTFCWTAGCEATVQPPSSSSKATPIVSSSSGSSITIDTPEEKVPVVQGLSMTDTRDNKTYTLIQVGSKLWTAQDMNYEVPNSECFNDDNSKCETNGRLYTFNAAQKACPTGWHLPNRDEAQAALDDESFPWSYSGRCKDGACDFIGEMGFHWTSATPQTGDKNFESNTGTSYAVIIVEKEPEYASEKEQKFFQVDSKTKRFSVRCIQD